jgi:hypothetical protein
VTPRRDDLGVVLLIGRGPDETFSKDYIACAGMGRAVCDWAPSGSADATCKSGNTYKRCMP